MVPDLFRMTIEDVVPPYGVKRTPWHTVGASYVGNT